MHRNNSILPDGWLAFEVGVLKRLQFSSVAIPFTGEPHLAAYLKKTGTRVATNDLAMWSSIKSKAFIEGGAEKISVEDVEIVLDGAYIPRDSLYNPALAKWFNETDAFWFDNVRDNLEKLASPSSRFQAMTVAMMVGDYVLSFDDDTRRLRTPLALSEVFTTLLNGQLRIPPASQRNSSHNREARDFIAEQHTELMFLRLPRAKTRNQRHRSLSAWKEEWVRGSDDFWTELERKRSGRLGDYVETRQQYLKLVEEFLESASHIESWAIAFVEDGFVSADELTESISRLRRIDAVYTKDFSELTGTRATLIVA